MRWSVDQKWSKSQFLTIFYNKNTLIDKLKKKPSFPIVVKPFFHYVFNSFQKSKKIKAVN